MKLLVLSHMYPHATEPTFGRFVHDQVKELSRRCEVVVVAPTPLSPPVVRRLRARWAGYAARPQQATVEGIEVHYPRHPNLPGKHGFPLSAILYGRAIKPLVLRLKDEFGFELIHAHAICPDGFAAAWLGGMVKTPVVCTIHGSDMNTYPHRTCLTRLVTSKAVRAVDVVVTVSAALREATLALAAPKAQIRVIPNGVDAREFAPMSRAEARAELGLPQDEAILVYASRLEEAKGLSYLLLALRKVLNQGNNCFLILVGEGPCRPHLSRQVEDLGLRDNVLFAGLRPHCEIPRWMAASDLVVHPSLIEGSPLSVHEALACGRPVVASRVGGIPELVVSDDYGLLVPPADPDALAAGLLAGLRKRWNADRIRKHGEQYTWRHVADQLINLYREVLASPPQ